MRKNKLKFLRRGFAKKCPNCGLFPIFSKYVKTHEKCSKCGISFSKYKSDDGPAYFTIFIVGHILIPLILLTEKNFSPPILLQMILWPIITIIITLWLLPKVKGAFLAFQIFVKDR
tara:strand:+ start:244 stop:591 length:348 start_codon:yes stop_codon:yes gene_type:complete